MGKEKEKKVFEMDSAESRNAMTKFCLICCVLGIVCGLLAKGLQLVSFPDPVMIRGGVLILTVMSVMFFVLAVFFFLVRIRLIKFTITQEKEPLYDSDDYDERARERRSCEHVYCRTGYEGGKKWTLCMDCGDYWEE